MIHCETSLLNIKLEKLSLGQKLWLLLTLWILTPSASASMIKFVRLVVKMPNPWIKRDDDLDSNTDPLGQRRQLLLQASSSWVSYPNEIGSYHTFRATGILGTIRRNLDEKNFVDI